MRQQLAALLARYTSQHLRVTGRPMLLHDADGRQVGAVDVISVEAGHLRLAGWAEAGTGMLHIDGQSTPFAIGLRREDVAQARGIAPDVGFDLTVPLGQIHPDQLRRVGVEIHDIAGTDQSLARPLPLPGLRRARARIVARFALTLARLSPAGVGWMLTRAPRFRAQIKRGLNLHTHTVAQALDKSLFTPAPTPTAPPAGRVTIVMPIYNAFELLDEALARVETHTDMPWRMVLIEDGSTDVRVRPFLRDWAAATETRADRVTLLENDGNKGFIRSVNRGFEQALAWGDPVILLNSDAFVPKGWASRLMRPLLSARDVATTTPMSNDAEIFTTPVICARADIPPRTVDAIDATARRLNGAVDLADAPTGVGFCMGMSIAYLKKLTALDTAFGRGYGEEVDWCQRARAIGGRHLGVPNLFVEHRGGQSFGSQEKLALVAANNAIISRRYPGYDAEVQRFIAADPMRSARMALGMAWAAAVTPEGTPVPVYLAHSMGGGAEHYLQDRIARDHLDRGLPAVVLRVGGPVRWQVELITPQGISAATMPDLDTVQDLLAPLTRRRLIYSCGVGDPDPLGLPGALLRLSAGGRHPVEILFHDFYPISPAYTLLGADGQYRGTPTPETVDTDTDTGHSQRGADGRMRSLADWQDAWGALMAQADRLVTFSQDSAAHVRTAYPQVAGQVVVAPHGLLAQVPALPVPGADRPRVVGVLGNIGYQKGAALLDDLGQTLQMRQGVALVVLGNVDPSYMPLRHATVHGSYALADLPELAARYGITDWLIPSIWPETFSYTTHEALATGLPVHAFDIGAQGEAVAKAAHGHSVGFAPDANLVNALAQHFRTHFEQSDTSST